mmetsp:Transcript_6471/g.11479  ORF Transcript_6471/g.11479 Transcript_6471/m.11479 type:complete len:270 (+) Transcript_6471:2256-3065(+)
MLKWTEDGPGVELMEGDQGTGVHVSEQEFLQYHVYEAAMQFQEAESYHAFKGQKKIDWDDFHHMPWHKQAEIDRLQDAFYHASSRAHNAIRESHRAMDRLPRIFTFVDLAQAFTEGRMHDFVQMAALRNAMEEYCYGNRLTACHMWNQIETEHNEHMRKNEITHQLHRTISGVTVLNRQIGRMAKKRRVKQADTCELDSRADTTCCGNNFLPIMFTRQTCGVNGFHGSLETNKGSAKQVCRCGSVELALWPYGRTVLVAKKFSNLDCGK